MSYRLFTRISSAVLALLMLGLTACGSVETDPAADTSADTVAVETETAETRPSHGLPDQDFEGAPFRISCYGDEDQVPFLQPAESTGEAVNDAIYNRNSLLMDEYNFVYETVAYGIDYQKHEKDITE